MQPDIPADLASALEAEGRIAREVANAPALVRSAAESLERPTRDLIG